MVRALLVRNAAVCFCKTFTHNDIVDSHIVPVKGRILSVRAIDVVISAQIFEIINVETIEIAHKIVTVAVLKYPRNVLHLVYAKIRILPRKMRDEGVDFKTVRDFGDIFDKGYGWRSWVEFWGYDIQGAIYQKIEQIATGRSEPLPFYLAAVTKERVPDIAVVEIPNHILEAALGLVEAKIDRFDLIKSGDVEPIRCEKCDYCKSTKILTRPEIYEIKEAE